MKKLDILIILITFIIYITTTVVYFTYNTVSGDDISVEIRYQNDVVYNIDYQESLNIYVSLAVEDDVLTITITNKDDKLIGQTTKKVNGKDSYNKVHLQYKHIKMVDASCPDRYCLKQGISGPMSTPIICTNGVTVSLKSNDNSEHLV